MNNHFSQPIALLSKISIFFFLIVVVPPSYCVGYDEQLSACSGKYIFQCGSGTGLNISYPFWGGTRPQYCGRKGFEIRCQDNQYHFIDSAAQKFRVLNISYLEPIMTIVRDDLWNDYCSAIVYQEINFNHNIFKYSQNVRNISLFHHCDGVISPRDSNYFSCKMGLGGEEITTGFYVIDIPELRISNLSNTFQLGIKVPVLLAALDDLRRGNLEQALKQGFEVEYIADSIPCVQCIATGGICGSNISNTEQFICLCPDQPQPHTCPVGPPSHPKTLKWFRLGGLPVQISSGVLSDMAVEGDLLIR
ncbi:hypothetical protein LWI29_025006 [Acer saccharum]|uniref:non-specific serine/threonine protein kinase n=1 Tax=Acer saccharum TaxID=4024 RepID=A0AA39SB83_ACESA|nr:hypothetical protein LWI29_025006 [Acer saccharum]